MPLKLDKKAITDFLRAHQSELRGLGVSRLGLFGSFVRDEATSESDVDILVEFEAGKKSFAAFIELAFWLEDALQRPVELVTPESLSPYLAPHILPTVEYVFESQDVILHRLRARYQDISGSLATELLAERRVEAGLEHK